MAGVPSSIADGPWWGVYLFLFVVVLLRAQATYWLGRWLRGGVTARDDEPSSRRVRLAQRFSGPQWDRATAFIERWGFLAIPVSFLTIGFQTMVNAAAGFMRMRWDLYTLAMLPGCAAWAAVYSVVGFSLVAAWQASPWLFVGAIASLVAIAWALTRLRRSAGSGEQTLQ